MSKMAIESTYSSHGLGDSGSNSNGLASTGVAASTVARSSRAGGGGNLDESDSLSLGGVEGRGKSVSGVLVVASLAGLGNGGLGASAGLGLYQC
jgi:hypothetical protein